LGLDEALEDLKSAVAGLQGNDESSEQRSGTLSPLPDAGLARPACVDALFDPNEPSRLVVDLRLQQNEPTLAGAELTSGPGVRDDSMVADFAVRGGAAQDLPASEVPAGTAGHEKPSFRIGFSTWIQDPDKKTIWLSAIVNMDCHWNVNGHGMVDIASEDDPKITSSNWATVVKALTPNDEGKPPRLTGGPEIGYWSSSISADHERYHCGDDGVAANKALPDAISTLNGKQIPGAMPEPRLNEALGEFRSIIMTKVQEHYQNGGEARAYSTGSYQYQALVNLINRRAEKEGWKPKPKGK
ncbi:MAG TPA: hypothetical protein VFO73_14880, partial [Candidatus Limnocylindrales bacterium]|nr:hypothetical protein [Candidatus Limnocylindrales bacterium]